MKGSFRNSIREWILKHEIWLVRVLYFAIILTSILVINKSFGYLQVISKPYYAVGIALLGAFLSAGGVALLLSVYLLLQMFAISIGVFVATAILLVCFSVMNGFFQAKRHLFFVFMPALYRLNLAYFLPIEAGFRGGRSEVTSVIGGAVMAFYLREVRLNASQIMESDGTFTIVTLIKNNIITNQMFYVFLLAMVVMFFAISFIRCLTFRHAWLVALMVGIVSEFLIMLAGYLFTGNSQLVSTLIITNALSLVFGLLFAVMFHDMDHSRMEKLQFEDDEYYYYVTAVPKIQFVREEIDVKNITSESSKSSKKEEIDDTQVMPKVVSGEEKNGR